MGIGHQERTAVDMVVWFLATAWASGIDRSVIIGHWGAGGEVFCGEIAGWIGHLAEKMMAVRSLAGEVVCGEVAGQKTCKKCDITVAR